MRKLKYLAEVRLSSVDKKREEGEREVRLCNYTDVYNNATIDNSIAFMPATASQEEVRRFALRKGDVIVTKDSEAWDDIAVPAYVADDLDHVLCGYHLAVVRPDPKHLEGRYLRYAFAARGIVERFHLEALGVTRFALGYDAIASVTFPVPTLAEQRAVAAFLDRETARIDALIAKKERLLALLEEKRTALITRAVTKGLDPAVPMKDSGVDYLKEIPAHWGVIPLKRIFDNLDSRRVPLSAEERGVMQKEYAYYGASGIIDHVESFLFDQPLILVAEDGANLYSRSTPLAFVATGKYWVNNHAHILKPRDGMVSYWAYALGSIVFDPWISGSAQPKLTSENLGSVPLAVPPVGERRAIVAFLESRTLGLDHTASKIRDAIAVLGEYRTALVSAAVTGQLDVTRKVETVRAVQPTT